MRSLALGTTEQICVGYLGLLLDTTAKKIRVRYLWGWPTGWHCSPRWGTPLGHWFVRLPHWRCLCHSLSRSCSEILVVHHVVFLHSRVVRNEHVVILSSAVFFKLNSTWLWICIIYREVILIAFG